MILCDAGPMIALIDQDDIHHSRCAEVLRTLAAPLVTTWPCLTEAMYRLHQAGGHRAQDELWGFVEEGLLRLHPASETEQRRMRALMGKYHDTPMDLADASLVAAAEVLNQRRVFSLDSDFYVYRIGEGRAAGSFEIVP